jgi:hypothetical protein
MAASSQKVPAIPHSDRGILLAEANTGNPLKEDFERMARRRFQDPKPRRRGNWWTIQVRQDVFVDGKLQRSNKRVRLAPVAIDRTRSSESCCRVLETAEPRVAERRISDQFRSLC